MALLVTMTSVSGIARGDMVFEFDLNGRIDAGEEGAYTSDSVTWYNGHQDDKATISPWCVLSELGVPR